MKILIVDDSKMMRNAIKKALTDNGLVAVFGEAGDGVEGLAAFRNHGGTPYNIVLIDWNMPNMVGIDLVKELRTFDKTTPLVMVTTEAEKHRVVDAVRAGINGYVVKPFEAPSLAQKVRDIMSAASKKVA